ncbi:hypothetical protein ACLOJK_016797 [Asimina triloba]
MNKMKECSESRPSTAADERPVLIMSAKRRVVLTPARSGRIKRQIFACVLRKLKPVALYARRCVLRQHAISAPTHETISAPTHES